MKSIFLHLLGAAAIAMGAASCVEVPGGYGPYYSGGGGGYYDHHHDHEHQHEAHCYCSHKSCGCKPGHPKGGCYCDHGEHRH